jgi:glycosyltransferase involved in cell wall biosynthesis
MKVLINTPDLALSGGVANHYIGLEPFWSYEIKYNSIGKRLKFGKGELWLLYDISKFVSLLLFWNPNLIVLNPSLAASAIKRDNLFLRIAKVLKIKVVVFIHGWDTKYELELNKKLFVKNFNRADGIIVLASEFKSKLINWGISKPVFLTTTKVDDRLLDKYENVREGNIKTILFLARIEKEKGVLIAIEIFSFLKSKYSNLQLRIVGSGNGLQAAKSYVDELHLKDVFFTGALSGKELINEFIISDVYLFPTFHGEGMPTTVLEAMGFGLPVITRPVGGIKDFFVESKMGFLVESHNANEYCFLMEKLMNDKELYKNISRFNSEYAKKNFFASIVASGLERIFLQVTSK